MRAKLRGDEMWQPDEPQVDFESNWTTLDFWNFGILDQIGQNSIFGFGILDQIIILKKLRNY